MNLVYGECYLPISRHRDLSLDYDTPEGTAKYRNANKEARLWLVLFTIALGCLIASKWYGVMGFGVSFVVLIAVWLQQLFVKRPMLWGNPRGFRLDVALAMILFISGTIYGLSLTKDLMNHADISNLTDVVYR